MSPQDTGLNEADSKGEDGAFKASFSWNDWFHLDEKQQTCVFKKAVSPLPSASWRTDMVEGQA